MFTIRYFKLIITLTDSRVQAELLKNEAVDVDLDVVSKITAQDFEDMSTDELNQFKFADIVTGR